jgi:hypothetical protein
VNFAFEGGERTRVKVARASCLRRGNMNILSLVPRQIEARVLCRASCLRKENTLLNLVVINSNYQYKYTL